MSSEERYVDFNPRHLRQLLGLILALLVSAFNSAPAFAQVIIGNASVGGLLDEGDSNFLNGSRVTIGSSSVALSAISVYVGNIDVAPFNQYQVGVYQDNGGSPGTLITSSTIGVLTPNSWNTLPVNATLQPNTTYWLMYNTNGRNSTVNNMRYNLGNVGDGSYSSLRVAFGSFPANFGAATLTTAIYSIYATATVGGGDTVPPNNVVISAPTNNSIVSGIVTVSANASDNASVPTVQFSIDDVSFGPLLTAPPYSIAWNTGLTTNGVHTIRALATDSAGNQTLSEPVTVAVDNADVRPLVGEWGPVMKWPLIAMHANLLKNGKVLIYDDEFTNTQPRLWDPITETFTLTPVVNQELWCSGHVQLADGRILVAGGHTPSTGEVGIKTTFVYDPDANTWTRTADMAYDRWYPALTKLSDGRVWIASGQIVTGVWADVPEIYDPASGSTTPMSNIVTPELKEEEYPANFYLPGGKVLAISPEHGPVQLLDPNAATWKKVNTTPVILGSAVQYRPGKILMSGGGPSFLARATGKTAVLDMNVTNPVWRETAPMSFGRYMHNLVTLPTGNVLAVGGASETSEQSTTIGPLAVEEWDSTTETWVTLASMQEPRMYHSTALLLPDGRVLAAGGGHNPPSIDYFSAQVYSPPYLFKGPRPTITGAPNAVEYGSGSFTVTSPDTATIASVALIGLESRTHGTDMTSFYRQLPFTATSNNEIILTAPQDGNEVPPGYYMLFIVNSNGVPSVAKILKIGATTPPQPPPPPPPATGTIGNTTIGSLLDEGDSNFLNGSKITTSGGGSIVSMSVYVGAVDSASNRRRYQLAIYTDNGGRPGTLIAQSGTGTLVANSWNTLPIKATLQANTSYWLIYNTNGRTTTVNNMRYNNGNTGQGVYSTNAVSFGNWPTTFPASTLTQAIYSLYATFGP